MFFLNSDSNKDNYVIGTMQIKKIDINYPIYSNYSDDLLKTGLCRFYGPLPNKIGNLCIAGHNYMDDRFFSKLNKLEINDTIEINDEYARKHIYYVYNKYEIISTDLSCLNQNTNGNYELTLVTCTNFNKEKRLVIKAIKK